MGCYGCQEVWGAMVVRRCGVLWLSGGVGCYGCQEVWGAMVVRRCGVLWLSGCVGCYIPSKKS